MGDRLRHNVGSESDRLERMLDLLLAVFRITGMEGEREVVFAKLETLRRLLVPLCWWRGRDTRLGNLHGCCNFRSSLL